MTANSQYKQWLFEPFRTTPADEAKAFLIEKLVEHDVELGTQSEQLFHQAFARGWRYYNRYPLRVIVDMCYHRKLIRLPNKKNYYHQYHLTTTNE